MIVIYVISILAKYYNAGMNTMRQLYFSALDMELHTR